jgi:cyclophilin family peptidyl-prolyl cis-trans isomerase
MENNLAGWAVILVMALGCSLANGGEPLCTETGRTPHLVIETAAGRVTVELFEDAAPAAVRRLVELARGPVFNPALVPPQGAAASTGYFDGLSFDYTKPHLEVMTAVRQPSELFELRTELDGRALGLHEDLLADAGKAMDVVQFELAPERDRRERSGPVDGRLGEWLAQVEEDGNAAFLVGTSRLEINQALGVEYVEGRASRPALRGMVAVKPVSPTTSELRLSFFLTDFPQRTGRWMVIGQVVDGLDLIDAISTRPLLGPPGWRNRAQTPRDAVTIESANIVCQPNTGSEKEKENS